MERYEVPTMGLKFATRRFVAGVVYEHSKAFSTDLIAHDPGAAG